MTREEVWLKLVELATYRQVDDIFSAAKKGLHEYDKVFGDAEPIEFSWVNLPLYEDIALGCDFCKGRLFLKDNFITYSADGMTDQTMYIPVDGPARRAWYENNKEEYFETLKDIILTEYTE